MRNKAVTSRPAARAGTTRQGKRTAALASSKKAEPIVQMVERRTTTAEPDLPKKIGQLPTPMATFVF
ncbi:MAG: hypothetical protein R3B48_30130 [Kofleriaceae bacterium]